MLPMKYVKEEEYFSKFGFLEDRILLLLVALGGDRKVIVDWYQGIGNMRQVAKEKNISSRGLWI